MQSVDNTLLSMVTKVLRVKAGLMPIWKSRLICVEVKHIVLLSCVRPIVEYGAEVWYPPTSRGSQLLAKIDSCSLISSGALCVVAKNTLALRVCWLNGV
jgi:hypothetical protein